MSQQDATRFYTDLFTRAPSHSTRYPNRKVILQPTEIAQIRAI